jgi:alkylated DNA repair protein (DNA oxidative demethylase)
VGGGTGVGAGTGGQGTLFDATAAFSPPTGPREFAPAAVHVPGWLDLDGQRRLVDLFRTWESAPAGLRHPRMPNGAVMSIRSVCLGWHWRPYSYSRTADDGAPVRPMPDEVVQLARAGVAEAYGSAGSYAPDAVIVNLYTPDARLGLHQDSDEPADAPVVTVSLGAACVFRFGTPTSRGRPYTDLVVRSGDLVVFGGPSRRAYHGVPRILPGTAPDGLGLGDTRLSITVRETGLAGTAAP